VKPSLLVLWGVCWMFVMALPISMSRSSSQPSSLSYGPRVFPTHKRSYCYCYGPTQRHEHHHYCKSCTLLPPSPPLLFIWSGCRVFPTRTVLGRYLQRRGLDLGGSSSKTLISISKLRACCSPGEGLRSRICQNKRNRFSDRGLP
jgi:hypothetical protein